jgi:AraC family transcriptional regulator
MRLPDPHIVEGGPLRIAGLARTFDEATSTQMDELWRTFLPYVGRVPGQKGDAAYGVLTGSGEKGRVEYLAGVEVMSFDAKPPELKRFEMPARRYAVFAFPGNVSQVKEVWKAIWNGGLDEAGLKPAEGSSFERDGAGFDPATGSGGFEIWIPVAAWPA